MRTSSNQDPTTPTISVISDTICPWCYVGKRRLEEALRALKAEGLAFDVEWRPYQLNPGMPEGGLDRADYRAAKFGAARSDALDLQMTQLGAQVGIGFRYDLIERTPSTLASHVMIADARRAGGLEMQNAAVEALFRGYFTQGRDIGRADVLREIAQEVGFDHAPSVGARLWELVEQEDLTAREAGVSGVPTFLLNERLLAVGAQPAEVIAAALRGAAAAFQSPDARTAQDRP